MKDHKINESNFKSIYDEYFDPVCRFLNLYTKDKNVIEDVVQELFCKLWINRDLLSIKHIKSYLYTSARNRMLNHIRDEKLYLSLMSTYLKEEDELRQAYELVDREEFNNRLNKAIDELPDKCKNVFKLSRYNKMTYKEIALSEGISEKMVEKHISTALKKLKEKIRDSSFLLF